jgi:hypothetical protein
MGAHRGSPTDAEIASAGGGLRAAVHSYVHSARRPNVKPHFKMGRPSLLARDTNGGGPWTVPHLCAAYDWPTGLPGAA